MAWRRNTTITLDEWRTLTADADRPLTDDPIRLHRDLAGWTHRNPSLIDQYLAREEDTP